MASSLRAVWQHRIQLTLVVIGTFRVFGSLSRTAGEGGKGGKFDLLQAAMSGRPHPRVSQNFGQMENEPRQLGISRHWAGFYCLVHESGRSGWTGCDAEGACRGERSLPKRTSLGFEVGFSHVGEGQHQGSLAHG